jgi:large subunit ribosomal protein L35
LAVNSGKVARLYRLCHNAAHSSPGRLRAAVAAILRSILSNPAARACPALRADMESKMPKMKTKSGAKKRFKITGTGKVKYQQSGKRHGMIKRTTKTIREHRGTAVLFKTDGDNVKKYWMPNG